MALTAQNELIILCRLLVVNQIQAEAEPSWTEHDASAASQWYNLIHIAPH